MKLILGIDPGFKNVGVTVVDIEPERPVVKLLTVLETKKSKAKQNVYAAADNVRRAQEIARALKSVVDRFGPENFVGLCSESQQFVRNAMVNVQVAMTWGIVVGVAESLKLSIIQIPPGALKTATAGNRTASKTEVQDALNASFGRNALQSVLTEGVTADLMEHCYDALGAVVAAMDSELVRMIRRMVK